MAAHSCANPLCGADLKGGRTDRLYCDSTCRSEAARLRSLLHSTDRNAKAVVAAVRKSAGASKPRGKRADTPYVVMEVQTNGIATHMYLVGFTAAHSRQDAIRNLADYTEPDAHYVALARRAWKRFDADGVPVP